MIHCTTCKFYQPHRVGNGVCVRYPSVVSKNPHDWCGEHVPAPVKPVAVIEAANDPVVLAVDPDLTPKPKRGKK